MKIYFSGHENGRCSESFQIDRGSFSSGGRRGQLRRLGNGEGPLQYHGEIAHEIGGSRKSHEGTFSFHFLF